MQELRSIINIWKVIVKEGATYLDLASKMTKDGNSLPAEYSSDGYVHHNKGWLCHMGTVP